MTELPNTTVEALGMGGTVKFRSPCPVIVEQVGVGNIATLTGNDTFTATETGEYLFENTCDCKGFYEVLDVGDMTDGCCVAPVVDADGALAGMTIAGVDYMIDDKNTTYVWEETNPVDGDGIVVWTATGSDGSIQDITIAEPTVDTDTKFVSQSIVDGVLVQEFTDVDGNPLPNIETDMSVLISSPLIAGDGITVDVDPVTGQQTVSSTVVDTDTDTTVTMIVTNNDDGSTTFQNVDDNGDPVGAATTIAASGTDTNVSSAGLRFFNNQLFVDVEEDGNTVSGSLPLPLTDRACGDTFIGIQGGAIGRFLIEPRREKKFESLVVTRLSLVGAAVDAVVGEEFSGIELPITALANQHTCYNDELHVSIRFGGVRFQMPTDGDIWQTEVVQRAANNVSTRMFAPPNTHRKVAGDNLVAYHVFSPINSLWFGQVNRLNTFTASYGTNFDPLIYTPHAENVLAINELSIDMSRQHQIIE